MKVRIKEDVEEDVLLYIPKKSDPLASLIYSAILKYIKKIALKSNQLIWGMKRF